MLSPGSGINHVSSHVQMAQTVTAPSTLEHVATNDDGVEYLNTDETSRPLTSHVSQQPYTNTTHSHKASATDQENLFKNLITKMEMRTPSIDQYH